MPASKNKNTYEIKTPRLHLRPFKKSDYSAWHEASTKCFKKKSKYDRGPLSSKESSWLSYNKRLARYLNWASHDHIYVWGAFERKLSGSSRNSEKLIGVIDILIVNRKELAQAKMGYRIFNNHWRKGFGHESLSAGIKFAFKNLKMNRIEAQMHLDNKASIALAKSVGLSYECVRRKAVFDKGEWRDVKIFSAQRETWGFAKLRR